MDPVIYTPRLKLVLVTKVEKGTPEFDQFHDFFTNEGSMWWSIHGRSKSPDDTATRLTYILPNPNSPKSYRAVYAVHRFTDTPSPTITTTTTTTTTSDTSRPTSFIGLINLKSLDQASLPLPTTLNPPTSTPSGTPILSTEIAYAFLPPAWNQGLATESVTAVYSACQRALGFWSPYEKVHVRALVNAENPASARVMEKVGMESKGVYEWKGKAVFLAGRWREEDRLGIWGRDLVG